MKKSLFLGVKITIGIIVFLNFFYIIFHRVDPDFWWHLKVGEWIIQNKTVPTGDIYSHTMTGYSWVDHEWLIDVLISFLYSHNLWFLIVSIFTTLVVLPFGAWLLRAKSYFSLWLVLIATLFMNRFVAVRPQLISFFLFFVLFGVLERRFSLKANTKKYYYLLPFLFFTWSNLHAGFASGLFLLGLSLIIYHSLEWLNKKRLSPTELKTDLGVLIASIATTFINPYGPRLYGEIFKVIFSGDTNRYNFEWQSGLTTSNPAGVFLIALFVSFIILFWKRVLKFPLPTVTNIVFFLFFLKSARHGPLFLIVGMPLLMQNADQAKNEIDTIYKKTPPTKSFELILKTTVLVVSLFPLLLLTQDIRKASHSYRFAPAKAVEFLKQQQTKDRFGNLFNDFAFGGYLIFKAPDIKVFIDGRMPHWISSNGTSAAQMYIAASGLNEKTPGDAWKKIFRENKIRTVFLSKLERNLINTESQNNLFEDFLKNYLIKRPRLTDFLRNLLGVPNFYDFKNELKNNGWQITYEDKESIILECGALCNY